ncbi:MAG: DUF4157 domain-containing protein [Anaerolineales bacterium]|nr:DUF4157 domain-containing protein [Anaerolineales bacterium]MCB8961470.1 DUF4157 domain-containing protein [Ardenticatenales bacterium]MCB0005882.1 DUF4157 domain-containing protein [Anaerolineales bacterium]MCB0010838.1 DUF4157 domain-containing protein [Anaerolineales bacterium]MCB0017566.1 DUF4157 domain-containing protein [Anaerolineales bacterium]
MATDFSFDDKGNVRPKAEEAAAPQKSNPPLTMSEVKGQLKPNTLNRMQQTLGNQAVQRLIAQRSGGEGASELDDETSSAINNRRGQGGQLDEGMAAKAGAAMGQDFSNVNVHTDSQADNLSRAVNAKAFTVGNDVFFKQGEYSPSTASGQHLIAHELTHVVQQGASTPNVQGKMTVNDPNDAFEKEADSVADSVMKMDEDEMVQGKADVQRDAMEEDEMVQGKADVQRQEEDELLQGKQEVQRQEEDELLQGKQEVQRQEEDELLQGKADVQRDAMEEDEMVQGKADIQRHEEHDL